MHTLSTLSEEYFEKSKNYLEKLISDLEKEGTRLCLIPGRGRQRGWYKDACVSQETQRLKAKKAGVIIPKTQKLLISICSYVKTDQLSSQIPTKYELQILKNLGINGRVAYSIRLLGKEKSIIKKTDSLPLDETLSEKVQEELTNTGLI